MKKAQLKIQQMAFMLIAVTLFFALAGMFVLVLRFSQIKNSASQLEEKNAMLLVTKLANSPEFSCGDSFGGNKINCIDADKAMILREYSDKYKGFWGKGVTNIEIRKIYPKTSKNVLCIMGNYPNCNVIRINQEEITGYYLSNFVSLCRKDNYNGENYNKCDLAMLLIGYEDQE